jgi:hypothetical protein
MLSDTPRRCERWNRQSAGERFRSAPHKFMLDNPMGLSTWTGIEVRSSSLWRRKRSFCGAKCANVHAPNAISEQNTATLDFLPKRLSVLIQPTARTVGRGLRCRTSVLMETLRVASPSMMPRRTKHQGRERDSLTSTPCFRPRLCAAHFGGQGPFLVYDVVADRVSAFPSARQPANPNYKDETPLLLVISQMKKAMGRDPMMWTSRDFWSIFGAEFHRLHLFGGLEWLTRLVVRAPNPTEVHDGSSSNTIDSPFLPHSSYVQRCSDSERRQNLSASLVVSEMEATLIQEIRTIPGTMTEKITWIRDIMSWGVHVPTTTRASSRGTFCRQRSGRKASGRTSVAHATRMDFVRPIRHG